MLSVVVSAVVSAVLGVVVSAVVATGPASAAGPSGWQWPVDGPRSVVRPFAPGSERWSAGHVGADLTGRAGQPVRAAGGGRVSYAGLLAGRGVVVVDHGGLRTTYEPLEVGVRVGAVVPRGAPLGRLAAGHPCGRGVCLHLGLRRGDTYLDPLRLFGGPVRLLPRSGAEAARSGRAVGPGCGRLVVCAQALDGGATGRGAGEPLPEGHGQPAAPPADGRAPAPAYEDAAAAAARGRRVAAPAPLVGGPPAEAGPASSRPWSERATGGLALLGLLGGLALLTGRPRPPAGGPPAALGLPGGALGAGGDGPPVQAGPPDGPCRGTPLPAPPAVAPAPAEPDDAPPLARVLALDDLRRRRAQGA